MDYTSSLEKMCLDLVDDWLIKQWANQYCAYYVYFRKPSDQKKIGEIKAFEREEAESARLEGWELADGRRLAPDWTKDQAFNLLRLEVVRRLPILGTELP